MHSPTGDQTATSLQQGNTTLSRPGPLGNIENYPFEFSATGSEYFRIWIVNLLLILVTFGIYSPWAKVRKLKYFYSNTRIDGHAFDFHGEPKKMLRGTMIVGAFFLVYSQAAEIAPIAGAVALIALLAVWPPLFRAAMKFRLANTSWHGMRFRFADTGLKEPYWSLVPPLALLLLPGTLMAFGGSADNADELSTLGNVLLVATGLLTLAWLALLPYFFWRIKRYQHNHYAWGPMQSEYRSGVAETYKIVGATLFVVLGLVALFGLAAVLLLPAAILSGNKGVAAGAIFTLLPLLALLAVTINIAPKAFFMARMQNLLWSRTGNRYFRFKSEISVRSLMVLQFKNYLFIMVTFGLYWPFAVVATKRMQLEAMSLRSRVDLDTLTDAARQRENDAAGDMAADLFGLDIGM